MGPTACGKSAIAIKIAQCFPVEIISVDSAQIYRYMDIGSAKPDQEIQESVPHHLIDVIAAYESYSGARFRSDSLIAMQAIAARGRSPLLVGGTLMYRTALSDGLAELPSADKHLREQLEQTARSERLLALHS